MTFFGEVLCKHCRITTRFLSDETETTTSESVLYLIGDEYPIEYQKSWENITSQCDYCGKENKIYVLIKENHIVDFLNENQMSDYLHGNYIVNPNKKEEMLQKEINQTSDVFDYYTTMDYQLHPIIEDSKITIQGETWNIKEIWKKELIEKDEEIRLEVGIQEGYIYLLEKNGGHKWFTITNKTERNVKFSVEKPQKETNEKWYDVHTDLQKTECIYQMKMGSELTLFAYQQLSGIHGQVFYQGDQLIYDVLSPSLEQLFDQVDEYINQYVL